MAADADARVARPFSDWGPVEALALLKVGAFEYFPAASRLILSPHLRRMLAWPDGPVSDIALAFSLTDRTAVRRLIERAHECGSEVRGEFHARSREGADLLVAVACRSVEEVDGTRVVGLIQDVTEPRLSERYLREREERWHGALKGSNFGVWDWDLRTNKVIVSGQILEALGYPAHHELGLLDLWRKHLHPDDRRKTLSSLRAHLRYRTDHYRVEHRILHADGTYRWMLARGAVQLDSEEIAIRMTGICTDITRRVETHMALEKSESRLRAIIEGSFDGMMIFDALRDAQGEIIDFVFEQANGRALDILDLGGVTYQGDLLLTLLPYTGRNGMFERMARVVTHKVPALYEGAGIVPADCGRIFKQNIVPVDAGVAIVLTDVTEQKAQAMAMRTADDLVSEIAGAVPEFLFVVDVRGNQVTYQNRSIRAALGYPSPTGDDGKDILLQSPLSGLLDEDDRDRLRDLEERVLRSNGETPLEVEVRLRRADGALEWLALRQSVFSRDEAGMPTHILSSASIVTHRKRAEERMREHVMALNRTQAELQVRQAELEKLNDRLQQLARRDGLTDVFNHRAFQERLTEEIARSRRSGLPLSLLLGDVDDFKAYNDRYGHIAGDDRLHFFGQVLQKCTRPSDFVARYGGEEFAVILPETTVHQGAIVAERILEVLSHEEGSRRITASFGLVQLTDDHATPASLIAAADDALYAAKREGKNRVRTALSDIKLG